MQRIRRYKRQRDELRQVVLLAINTLTGPRDQRVLDALRTRLQEVERNTR